MTPFARLFERLSMSDDNPTPQPVPTPTPAPAAMSLSPNVIVACVTLAAIAAMWLKPWEAAPSPAPGPGPNVPTSSVAFAVTGPTAAQDAAYFAACFDAAAERVEATGLIKDWEAFKKFHRSLGTAMTAKRTTGKYPQLPGALEAYWLEAGKQTFSSATCGAQCRALAAEFRRVK
jgi:hypothetical protein